MQNKMTGWKTKGMNRDLSVSAFNSEFSFENVNLRLATVENNTLMSWVNERGPKKLTPLICEKPWADNIEYSFVPIIGAAVGTAVINHQLVLFTTDKKQKRPDRIYVFWYENAAKTSLVGKLIYSGHLNFNINYPFETLPSFEAEHIQKIYWTDGLNQPRLININASKEHLQNWNSTADDGGIDTFFDFIPSVELKETMIINKLPSSSGTFAPGVIQGTSTELCQAALPGTAGGQS